MTDFKKTDKQKQAIKKLSSKPRHCMLYGGSRSGKTLILIYALIVRACKIKSRHVVLRDKFNHVKTSIWLDTLPKVMKLCFPDLPYHKMQKKTDYYLEFPNGSEIWFAGLDDSERVEKILGKEYSTLYFNECSQISYASIQIALTRLAEKNELRKKIYYDCNPPKKRHWSYSIFIKNMEPETDQLLDPDDYCTLLMNPTDNIDNIDEDYVTNILAKLPEKDRARFLLGEFGDDNSGATYYSFSRENNVQEIERHPEHVMYAFVDFNVDPLTGLIAQFYDDKIYILDEIFQRNSNTRMLAKEIKEKAGNAYIIPDSTGRNRKTSGQSDFMILEDAGFTIMEVRNPLVVDRVGNVNRLLEQGNVIINPKCVKLIGDLEKVCWRENSFELDQKKDPLLTHISDALGYGCHKLMPSEKIIESRRIKY